MSLLIDPYNTWGEPPRLRSGVAETIRGGAGIAALMFLASALLVYSEEDNRRGWKGWIFAIVLLFFTATSLARMVWIQFWVLA